MKYPRSLFILLVFFLSLTGLSCTAEKQLNTRQVPEPGSNSDQFTLAHEQAADNLLDNCQLPIDQSGPIIVTSLVDIDQMGKSSTLGRMSSEIIASRLAQHQLKVREVKMSQSDIFVSQEEGEFILSRNLREIGEKHQVQGFVVGTYAIGRYNRYDVDVYISIRFVNTDNIITCSENYVLANTDPELWK